MIVSRVPGRQSAHDKIGDRFCLREYRSAAVDHSPYCRVADALNKHGDFGDVEVSCIASGSMQ